MKMDDVPEGVVRVYDEAGPHPREEGRPGEHRAAPVGPGRHVPGVASLPHHQDELVTPGVNTNFYISQMPRRTYWTATDLRSCK